MCLRFLTVAASDTPGEVRRYGSIVRIMPGHFEGMRRTATTPSTRITVYGDAHAPVIYP